MYVLRTLYNVILSDGENKRANIEWSKMQPILLQYAHVDLEQIIKKVYLSRNVLLCRFLKKAQELMVSQDTEGLKAEIRRRERELKPGRAKTMHPGEFDITGWYGGGHLDYRFGNAKVIIRDIFESEGQHA